MKLELRECTLKDINTLQQISCRTFKDAFADANSPQQLQIFLDNAYNADKLGAELLNKYSKFMFLYCDGELAGYFKINEAPAQTDLHDSASLEIERIYIKRGYQRMGLGGYIIDKAADTARTLGKKYIWLGVWENNLKAISFYKKHGFYKIGSHSFFVGNDEQTDYIMRKDL
mgnify:CR=1 FL=1